MTTKGVWNSDFFLGKEREIHGGKGNWPAIERNCMRVRGNEAKWIVCFLFAVAVFAAARAGVGA